MPAPDRQADGRDSTAIVREIRSVNGKSVFACGREIKTGRWKA